jgi:hypothetical protein
MILLWHIIAHHTSYSFFFCLFLLIFRPTNEYLHFSWKKPYTMHEKMNVRVSAITTSCVPTKNSEKRMKRLTKLLSKSLEWKSPISDAIYLDPMFKSNMVIPKNTLLSFKFEMTTGIEYCAILITKNQKKSEILYTLKYEKCYTFP